ncbi:xylulokinase [Shimia sp. MIT910701]|uniref:xylulokinase n=1 Tax=Shimia sp. MIT910701 TaxID=3096987 RepID=UPI00399B65EE
MTKGDLVISADFGTSGVKVGVVDSSLSVLARVTESYPLVLKTGGIAEQSPDDWWGALAHALATLRQEVPDLSKRAAALVFSSQLCGLVCCDANGTPLRPCLTWLDKRAAPLGKKLTGGFPEVHGYNLPRLLKWLRLANGAPAKNGMDPTAKMLWVMRQEPEIYAKTRWMVDVKDWLVHRATGEMTTSPESANLSWVMDSRTGREGWSDALCAFTGIERAKLAPITQADTIVGTLTPQAAAELGLDATVKVLGGTSDVMASALGSGEVNDGALHISVATSAWIAGFFPTRRLSVAHSYATITSGLGYRPLLIASQENAGSALDWVCQLTGNGAKDTRFAAIGTPQDDDPFFLPWLAGERVPVDNSALRGTFHGLSLHHDKNALRRATIEGVALNLRWAMSKVAREKGAQTLGPLSIVGGVASDPVFAQTLADALNRDIRVCSARHAGMLGTATLAAPLMGWAGSVCDAAATLKTRTSASYTPNPTRTAQLAARAEQLAKIRRLAIRSYT